VHRPVRPLGAADVSGPSWLAGTFAAIMILTAGYCASRLVAARQCRRPAEFDVDVMHTIMGVAMAGMLVPRLNLLRYGSWEVVFAAATGWFGWQIIGAYRGRPAHAHPSPGAHRTAHAHSSSDWHRPTHHAPHLLACGAMLYMYLVAGAARSAAGVPGMPASGTSASTIHSPGLALPLAAALLGYVIWTTDRLTALPRAAALGSASPTSAPLTSRALTSRALTSTGLTTGARLTSARLTSARMTDGTAARQADRQPEPRRPPMSPRLAACCEIAMGVTMAYLLIQLI
jgi:hypothetical protein